MEEKVIDRFGLRGYKWDNISFGFEINLNEIKQKDSDGKTRLKMFPSVVITFWRYTFVLGWDQFVPGDGTTLL